MGRSAIIAKIMALLCALSLAAAACSGNDSDQAPAAEEPAVSQGPGPAPRPLTERTDVVGTVVAPIGYFLPVHLASVTGEFEKENLNVTVEVLGTSDSANAVASGAVDFAFSGLSARHYELIAQSDELRQTGSFPRVPDAPEGIWVNKSILAEDGSLDPEAAGRLRIAAGSRGIASPVMGVVGQWLEDNGVAYTDPEYLPLDVGDITPALQEGEADVAYVVSPLWVPLLDDDCCVYIEGSGIAITGAIFRTEFMQERPEVVEAILRALVRTTRTYLAGDYYADNPETLALAGEWLGIDEQQLLDAPLVPFETQNPVMDPAAVEAFLTMQAVWLAAGVLEYDEPLTVERFVDDSALKRVLAEG